MPLDPLSLSCTAAGSRSKNDVMDTFHNTTIELYNHSYHTTSLQHTIRNVYNFVSHITWDALAAWYRHSRCTKAQPQMRKKIKYTI